MEENQVIWITGGGSGIGRALAIHWALLGHRVVISGRRVEHLQAVVEIAKQAKGEVQAFACDITDERAAEQCAADIVARFGKLDVCVANAGYSVVAPFESTSPEEWRRQMDVNLFGAIWTMRAGLPHLRKTKGRLAVVSSVSGKMAVARTAAYSASKFALVGVCNALYLELAGSGVSVTNILPGLIDTEIAKVDNKGVFRTDRVDKRPKRLMWPAERAAKEIAKAIEGRRREAVITGHGKLAVFMANHFSGFSYWMMAQRRNDEYF